MLYYAAAQLHRWLYRSGWKAVRALPAPVICIGNLTMGGSGKTPLVIALARLLHELQYRPAIVSRGYRRAARSGEPLVVGDGRGALCAVERAGDEPLLIARSLPQTPVIVCADRYAGGRLALERFQADVIVLDDGFQHWALKRELDLVCIDCGEPLSAARLLPFGRYREPPSAVSRAAAIFLTRAQRPEQAEAQRRFLRESGFLREQPVWTTPAAIGAPRALAPDAKPDLEGLRDRRVLAVCAIAAPGFFRATLVQAGARLLDFIALPDHDPYARPTVQRIERRAAQLLPELIVTTQKDAVKLTGRTDPRLPWRELPLEIEWPPQTRAEIARFLQRGLASCGANE